MRLAINTVFKIYESHNYDLKLLTKEESDYIKRTNNISRIIQDLENNPNRIDELENEFKILNSKISLFDKIKEREEIRNINKTAVNTYFLGVN